MDENRLLWAKFDGGGNLTDAELSKLVVSAKFGIEYLAHRGRDKSPLTQARADLETIEAWQEMRYQERQKGK